MGGSHQLCLTFLSPQWDHCLPDLDSELLSKRSGQGCEGEWAAWPEVGQRCLCVLSTAHCPFCFSLSPFSLSLSHMLQVPPHPPNCPGTVDPVARLNPLQNQEGGSDFLTTLPRPGRPVSLGLSPRPGERESPQAHYREKQSPHQVNDKSGGNCS